MVLGGASVPLDLGTSQRLFTKAQAVALSALHDQCAAEGCERPFAWCELHHKQPWGHGGPTDLANAAPLCGHHHRRIHDPMYEHEWLPTTASGSDTDGDPDDTTNAPKHHHAPNRQPECDHERGRP
jgi:hypothetical protein